MTRPIDNGGVRAREQWNQRRSRFRVAGLALLLALALSRPGDAIVGGVEVSDVWFATHWPFVVAIENQFPNGAVSTSCTGTLIAPDLVVTAAHCLADLNGATIVVRTGSANRTLGDAHALSDATTDPFFRGVGNAQHDLAVLQLVDPVINVPTIRPLRQSEKPSFVPSAQAEMAGWGLTPGNQPTNLREASRGVPVDLSQTYLALGTPATCSGDSGGPLVFTLPATGERVLAGVTSLGDSACTEYSEWADVAASETFISGFLSRPSLTINTTPASGAAPLVTSIQATATDPDGIASVNFDPGDGEAGSFATTSTTFTHTYRAPGSFSAVVTATDTRGFHRTVRVPIAVSGVSGAPEIVVSESPFQGTAPLVTTWNFSGSTDDGAIVQYRLDPGDGGAEVVSTSPIFNYTYAHTGTFSPIARVVDNDGYRATRILGVRVNPRPDVAPPVLHFTITPLSGAPPLQVHFDLRASTDDVGITDYVVFPGVGDSELLAPGGLLDFTYLTPGTYIGYVGVFDGIDSPDHFVFEQFAVTVTAPVSASILDATVTEGAGIVFATVQVALSRAVSGPVTLKVATVAPASGTPATAGADFAATSQLVTIPAGALTGVFTLPIVGDSVAERTETLGVKIFSASNGITINRSLALVTVLDDDDRTGPAFFKLANVNVESKLLPVKVSYQLPAAIDAVWGAELVRCAPLNPIVVQAFGTTIVTCSAVDGAGNLGTAALAVTVRPPTTGGAVTNPGNLDKPILEAARNRELRVTAGGFAAGSRVSLSVVTETQSLFVTDTTAGADGRIDVGIKIPHDADEGAGEVHAEGIDAAGNTFVRAWKIAIKGGNGH